MQIPFTDSLPPYQPGFVQSMRQEVDGVFEILPSLQKEDSESVQPFFSTSVEYMPEVACRTGQEPAIFVLPFLICLCFIALNRLYLLFSKNSKAGERLVSSFFCREDSLRKPISWWNLFLAFLSGATCCAWVMLSTHGYISNTWKSMGVLVVTISGYLLLKWFLFYLSSLLGVTDSTISNDLDKLEGWFEGRGLTLVRKPGLGVYVEGEERRIRQAIIAYIYDHVTEEELLHLVQQSLRPESSERASS